MSKASVVKEHKNKHKEDGNSVAAFHVIRVGTPVKRDMPLLFICHEFQRFTSELIYEYNRE